MSIVGVNCMDVLGEFKPTHHQTQIKLHRNRSIVSNVVKSTNVQMRNCKRKHGSHTRALHIQPYLQCEHVKRTLAVRVEWHRKKKRERLRIERKYETCFSMVR